MNSINCKINVNKQYIRGFQLNLFDKFENIFEKDPLFSLKSELSRILNARKMCKKHNLDYIASAFGVPDLSEFDFENSISRNHFTKICKKLIMEQDKRWINLNIKLLDISKNHQKILIQIEGLFQTNFIPRSIRFNMHISKQ